MKPILRAAGIADEGFLREMLYLAVFVPPGHAAPPRDIIARPELARYVDGFGVRAGDLGFIAEDENPVGAAWVRLLGGSEPGYGFIDDDTPELSMAALPSHRGRGIGTALLGHLLERVPRCSLSVDDRNRAIELYGRSGFVALSRSGHSVTMLYDDRANSGN